MKENQEDLFVRDAVKVIISLIIIFGVIFGLIVSAMIIFR